MKVREVLLGAGVTALVLLILVLSPGSMATARRPASLSGFIPIYPDFPIWDGLGANACSEMNADVAYNDTENEYLVVFDWDLGGTGHSDIMAITVSADGQPAISPFSVAGGTDDDSNPAIAYNPDEDNYLVVWERVVGGERSVDIYGKIITHSGGVGTEVLIAGHLDNQYSPDVAYAAGSDHYLVVWQDHSRTLAAPPDIYGRCLDQDGTWVGWGPLAIGVAAGGQDRPALATNGFNHRWLVAWFDGRSGGWNTYGREVDSAGDCSLPASDFAISDQAGLIGAPAVAWGQVEPSLSPFGEFLVVWPHGYEMLMLAQRLHGADYSLLGDPITVSDYPGMKGNPAVVFAGSEWWVVWQDDRDFVDPGSGYLIYGQRVLPDGTVRGASVNQRVSKDPDWLPPSVWQEAPAMAHNATTGNVLVAWDDHGHYDESDAGHWGIWGRMWAPVERVFLPLVVKSWP